MYMPNVDNVQQSDTYMIVIMSTTLELLVTCPSIQILFLVMIIIALFPGHRPVMVRKGIPSTGRCLDLLTDQCHQKAMHLRMHFNISVGIYVYVHDCLFPSQN